MERADQLCEHIFVFDDSWDMEPCGTPYQMESIDWNMIHHQDEEWVFMLNRLGYLRHLLLAYLYTGSEKYTNTWREITKSWLNAHPDIIPSLSTRPLDTALRCTSLLEGCSSLLALLPDEELEMICESILQQLAYLKASYIPKYTLSNWGFLQTAAILECLPVLVEDYRTHSLYQWAFAEFQTQLHLQILEDGMHWEQSTMYHVEVLYAALRVLHQDTFYEYGLSELDRNGIYRMAKALLFSDNGNHQIDAYGDSDITDLQEMVTLSGIIFQDTELLMLGGKPMTWWLFYETGKLGFHYMQNHTWKHPNQLLYKGDDCGIITLRDAWEDTTCFTQFNNSRLGSSHGHSDHLHLSLYDHHQPILIDCGRYTYREDHPLRPYLKSMAAHNTIILDEEPASIPIKSWEYEHYSSPLKNYVREVNGKTYIEGTYRCSRYTHTRKIILPCTGIWLIADDIYAQGEHHASGYFHYHPDLNITSVSHDSYTLRNNKTNLAVTHVGIDSLALNKVPHAFRYNEIGEHSCLKTERNFHDHMIQLTCIHNTCYPMVKEPIWQSEQKEAAASLASAFTFQLSETESVTIVLFHQEIWKGRKLCICRGVPIYGECCILHETKGKIEISRMKV